MIKEKGKFKKDGEMIWYNIDERLTDGQMQIIYKIVDSVDMYSRRKGLDQLEVNILVRTLKLQRQMTVQQIKINIEEFYKECLNDANDLGVKISNEHFACKITEECGRWKMEYYDFYEDRVKNIRDTLEYTNEQLANLIYAYRKSAYKR